MQVGKRIHGRPFMCQSFQRSRTPCGGGALHTRAALLLILPTIPKTFPVANASASSNNNTNSTSSSELPQPHGIPHNHDGSTAPLRLVELPGRGRGLVAARKLSPGELLLVCRPLALVQGQSQSQGRREPRDQQSIRSQPQPPKPGPANHGVPSQWPSGAAPAVVGGGRPGVEHDAAAGVGDATAATAGVGDATAATAGAAIVAASGPGQQSTTATAAAASAGGTASAVAAAAACSEAALVAELERLEWGPRRAQILAFLYRGTQPARPAGLLRPGASAGTAAQAAAAPTAAPSGPMTASVGATSDQAAVSLDLPDLLDPWASSSGGFADSGCWGESNRGGKDNDRGSTASEPSAEATATAATHGSGLTSDKLAAVVRLNATGLPSDDVLLAKVYDRPNVPYIGLWPAHAMINHSCAPNAVAVVSGEQLLVRCCSPVPVGGEVCITYSGALGLGPLPLRRALLERNHRFRCTCARCTTEEQTPRELAQLWSDIIMLASQHLQPQLIAAAAKLRGAGGAAAGGPAATAEGSSSGGGGGGGSPAGSAAAAATTAASSVLPALLEVRSQAAKCCGLFEETLQQLAPSPQETLWLQASMYPLYETRARCAQVLAAAAAAAGPEALRLVATDGSTVAAAGSGGSDGGGSRPAAPVPRAPPSRQTLAGGKGAATVRRDVGLDAGPDVGPDWGSEQDPDSDLERERRRWWLSEEYLEALSVCLRLQGAANAGSDMHVQLAARYDSACAAHAARYPGPHSRRISEEARLRLERVLVARYGAVSDAAAAPTEGPDAAETAAAAQGSVMVAATAATTTPFSGGPTVAGWAAPAPSLESLLRILGELQPQQ